MGLRHHREASNLTGEVQMPEIPQRMKGLRTYEVSKTIKEAIFSITFCFYSEPMRAFSRDMARHDMTVF